MWQMDATRSATPAQFSTEVPHTAGTFSDQPVDHAGWAGSRTVGTVRR